MPSQDRIKAEIVRRTGYTLAALSGLIDEYDTIVFDVFGTLLPSYLLQASDTYEYLEKEHDLPGFRAARQKSEQLARRRFGSDETPEVDIDEIYQVLSVLFPGHGVGPHDEFLAEISYRFADPAIGEILKIARQKGKRIVGLSDACLHKGQVAHLLEVNGIELDELYVYPDIRNNGTAPFGGGVLSLMIQEERIEPQHVLYFGADLAVGASIGLVSTALSVHVQPLAECMQWDEIPFNYFNRAEETPTTKLIRGHVAARLPHYDPEESDMYIFGYNMAGPLLLGFCDYIWQNANNDGVDQMLFSQSVDHVIRQAIEISQPLVPRVSVFDPAYKRSTDAGSVKEATGTHDKPQNVAFVDVDWNPGTLELVKERTNAHVQGYFVGTKRDAGSRRGYLFGGETAGDAEPEPTQCNQLIKLLFSPPLAEAIEPSSEAGDARSTISFAKTRAFAVQCVQRGALDFLRSACSSQDTMDGQELADYNRFAFCQLASAPTKREFSAFATVPFCLEPDKRTWGCIEDTWVIDWQSRQRQVGLKNNQLRQLRNYDWLLPASLKRLSLRDDIDQMDWRREIQRHPLKVSYWNSIRRYLRRKAD